MFQLENRVVIVTGGTKGIGAACVRLLVEYKAKVVSLSRNAPENPLDGVLYLECDVTKKNQCDQSIEIVRKQWGDIYGIICNAGITKDKTITKMQDEYWSDVLDVNLTGAYNSVKSVIRNMFENKCGSVVFVSSIIGEKGNIGQSNYAASKAAIIGLMKSLALESARHHVRVNAVSPGFVETDMTAVIPETIKERLIGEIPLGRFALPEEIAHVALFLLSPTLSSFITGEVIRVNGGHLT